MFFAEVKAACSTTLRTMYLYPDCDYSSSELNCLSLEDITSRLTSSIKSTARPSTTKVPVLQSEENKRKNLGDLIQPTRSSLGRIDEGIYLKRKHVPISVLIPYTKPERRSNQDHALQNVEDQIEEMKQSQIKEENSTIDDGNKDNVEESLISSESQQHEEANEASPIKRMRQNGPTRTPKNERPRVGSIIIPTTDVFLHSDFVTRFPFPKVDNFRQRRPVEGKRLVAQPSREVQVLYPQRIRPNRFKRPRYRSSIQPIKSPVFVDAGVSFRSRINSRKNYKEIFSRPGLIVRIGEISRDIIGPDVPLHNLANSRHPTGFDDMLTLASYEARAVGLKPIRASLLKEQLQVTPYEPQQRLSYATLKPIVPITTSQPIVTSPGKHAIVAYTS